VVKDEVIEVGKIRMIKVPFTDVLSLDDFSPNDRKFLIELGRYYNADLVDESVTLHAPAGAKFADIPENESFAFSNSRYSIQYTRINPGTVKVTQTLVVQRTDVPAAEYKGLKDFLSRLVKAQSKYITFK
jgi:hypothetical protein